MLASGAAASDLTATPAGEGAGCVAPVLRLVDLAVGFPRSERRLLSSVELELGPGACVALVGPSGSGKTTLLRTINGQIPPKSGRVVLEEEDLAATQGKTRRRLRSRIGLIPQQHDLVEPLAVHANVMAGALGRWSNLRALRYLFRPTAAELAEAREALAAVGLADKLRASTAALSGGEQQRVAIARALVQAPRLLLADEPVASLDPEKAREVLVLLTGLARDRGMALVCSLHQPELARRYFDRVLELRDGALRGAGGAEAEPT